MTTSSEERQGQLTTEETLLLEMYTAFARHCPLRPSLALELFVKTFNADPVTARRLMNAQEGVAPNRGMGNEIVREAAP